MSLRTQDKQPDTSGEQPNRDSPDNRDQPGATAPKPTLSLDGAMQRMRELRTNGPAEPTPDGSAADRQPKADKPKDDDDDFESLLEGDDDKPSTVEETRQAPQTDDDPIVFELDGTPIRKSEALKGYTRQADYSRKTSELAEQRKALEAEAAEYQRVRGHYTAQLKAQYDAAQQNAPKAPDPALQATDPILYQDQAVAFLVHQQNQQQRAQEIARLEQEQRDEQTKLFRAKLAEESAKMVEVVPSLKRATPEQRKVLMARFKETAKQAGYSDAELGQLADHRAIVLLEWATRGLLASKRRGSAAAPTGQPNIPTPRPNGAVLPTTLKGSGSGGASPTAAAAEASKDVRAAEQKLRRTGRMNDALELMRARRASRSNGRETSP